MRSFEVIHASRSPRAPKLWVAETLVVLGIVAFGLFALALEGHFNPLAKPANTVELPFELTR